MYELAVLREFLSLLALPRHRAKELVPDGSGVWLCLAYGLEQLVERLPSSELGPSAALLDVLNNLAARVGQFAVASRTWAPEAEWQSIEEYARKAKTLLEPEELS